MGVQGTQLKMGCLQQQPEATLVAGLSWLAGTNSAHTCGTPTPATYHFWWAVNWCEGQERLQVFQRESTCPGWIAQLGQAS